MRGLLGSNRHRHCEERSDEAIQDNRRAQKWRKRSLDCFGGFAFSQ
jgi:hypothetical protein